MANPRVPFLAWLALGVVGLALAAAGTALWRIGNPTHAPRALPDALIAHDTPRGRTLLAEAEASADHLPILRAYVPQQKLTWCGVASATIALNALRLHEPGPMIQQQTLFDRRTRPIKTRLGATLRGVTLGELSALLDARGAATSVRHARDDTPERFRALATANLADPSDVLLVNYDRRALGQPGGGHISPVVAWDRETDRVLLADTAAYLYPWHWVRVPDLFAAMATEDPASGRSRGYVTVRRGR